MPCLCRGRGSEAGASCAWSARRSAQPCNWRFASASVPLPHLPAAGNQQPQDEALLEVLVDAGPEAVQALKRCERNLPDTWTGPLRGGRSA